MKHVPAEAGNRGLVLAQERILISEEIEQIRSFLIDPIEVVTRDACFGNEGEVFYSKTETSKTP